MAHLTLIVALFALGWTVFGGGLFAASLGLVQGALGVAADDPAGSFAFLSLVAAFLLNLIVYYAISSVLILLYNLVFRKDKK